MLLQDHGATPAEAEVQLDKQLSLQLKTDLVNVQCSCLQLCMSSPAVCFGASSASSAANVSAMSSEGPCTAKRPGDGAYAEILVLSGNGHEPTSSPCMQEYSQASRFPSNTGIGTNPRYFHRAVARHQGLWYTANHAPTASGSSMASLLMDCIPSALGTSTRCMALLGTRVVET